MREFTLFSEKIYTAGTNLTRPPVVTVATNINSGPLQPFFSYLICPVLSLNSRFPGNFCLLLFSKSFTETQCLINEETSCVDSVQRKSSPEQIATTENDIACGGGIFYRLKYELLVIIKPLQWKTRPSALGKSDPFCGPSNPRYLFTKDYTIFCGPSNPQYLFPKDYAIFF